MGGGFAVVVKGTLANFHEHDKGSKMENKYRVTENELPLTTPSKTVHMTKVLIFQFGTEDVIFSNSILRFTKPVLPHTVLSVRVVKGFTTGVPFDKLENDQKIFPIMLLISLGELTSPRTPNQSRQRYVKRRLRGK